MTELARLTRRAEFVAVAGKGRAVSTPGLVLQAMARPGDGAAARVGFTASRRVGIAVERNRARRRLKAAAARLMPEHAAPGRDYVVIARSAAVRRPFAALCEDLAAALHRLGAWRDGGGAPA